MWLHYHQLFFLLPDDEIPTSLPVPLPAVDLDDDREPSRFAYECGSKWMAYGVGFVKPTSAIVHLGSS